MGPGKIIAVDFDGTIVDHRFPDVGDDVPGAFAWLKRFQDAGARLILWTMRSDGREDGTSPLSDAVERCRSRGVEFWAVNENPEQSAWTGSPKVYAHVYIDDAAACCPLLGSLRLDGRPYVDWEVVGPAVLALLQGPCPDGQHQWTARQLGGAPDMAESTEWVCYCKKCGAENVED